MWEIFSLITPVSSPLSISQRVPQMHQPYLFPLAYLWQQASWMTVRKTWHCVSIWVFHYIDMKKIWTYLIIKMKLPHINTVRDCTNITKHGSQFRTNEGNWEFCFLFFLLIQKMHFHKCSHPWTLQQQQNKVTRWHTTTNLQYQSTHWLTYHTYMM